MLKRFSGDDVHNISKCLFVNQFTMLKSLSYLFVKDTFEKNKKAQNSFS